MSLSRKEFLQLGLVAGAGLALPRRALARQSVDVVVYMILAVP